MCDFQREERYIVIKLKDLSHTQMSQICAALDQNKIEPIECVVVESDWPIYDETWDNIQRLAEGRSSIQDELSHKLFEQHRATVRAKDALNNAAASLERSIETLAAIGDLPAMRADMESALAKARGEQS